MSPPFTNIASYSTIPYMGLSSGDFINFAAGACAPAAVFRLECGVTRLTKARSRRIITVKSKPRTRLAPQSVMYYVALATKQPSLVRSGGCFFCVFALCLPGSFIDDNRHSPLLYVEGQAHTHHPLSCRIGDGTNRLRVCCLLFYHRTLSGDSILQKKNLFVNLS